MATIGPAAAPPPTLLDLVNPLVKRIQSVAEAVARGQPPGPAADINRDLYSRLRGTLESAQKSGKDRGAAGAALFAVAALADQMLSTHKGWYGESKGLLSALYKGEDPIAGTVERLRALPGDETEARLVILYVLGLGLGAADATRADAVADLRRQEADRMIALLERRGGLLKEPPDIGKRASMGSTTGTAAPVALAGCRVRGRCSCGRRWLVVDRTRAGHGGWTRIRRPCSTCCFKAMTALGSMREFEEAGELRLYGHVQSAEDRARLVANAGTLGEFDEVDVDVDVLPWPQCAVAATLASNGTLSTSVPPGIQLADGRTSFQPGDNLVIDVAIPSTDVGYLYVDLVDVDGEVLHLLPEPAQPNNIVSPGDTVRIGTTSVRPDPLERQWSLARPVGRKMIVVLATSVPLFADVRPPRQSLDAYLADLEESLSQLPDLGISTAQPGAYLTISVEE